MIVEPVLATETLEHEVGCSNFGVSLLAMAVDIKEGLVVLVPVV